MGIWHASCDCYTADSYKISKPKQNRNAFVCVLMQTQVVVGRSIYLFERSVRTSKGYEGICGGIQKEEQEENKDASVPLFSLVAIS
ncbi:Alanine--tRNA ligase [Dirofilaria immitis]